MNNEQIIHKVIAGVVGKAMTFTRLGDGAKGTMKIMAAKPKCGNLIFVGESFSVGFFSPIGVWSMVKGETEAGWNCGEFLDDVTIGGIPALQAFTFILAD